MIFLLDQDVPEDIIYSLLTLGHDVHKLRDVLRTTASDEEVLRKAIELGSVLITCNRDDFLKLAKRFENPGLIILVRRRSRALERAALIQLLDRATESGIRNNINFA